MYFLTSWTFSSHTFAHISTHLMRGMILSSFLVLLHLKSEFFFRLPVFPAESLTAASHGWLALTISSVLASTLHRALVSHRPTVSLLQSSLLSSSDALGKYSCRESFSRTKLSYVGRWIWISCLRSNVYYFCTFWLITCFCKERGLEHQTDSKDADKQVKCTRWRRRRCRNRADISAAFPACCDTAAHQPAACLCVCMCEETAEDRWRVILSSSPAQGADMFPRVSSFQRAALTREVPGDEHGGQNGSLRMKRRRRGWRRACRCHVCLRIHKSR